MLSASYHWPAAEVLTRLVRAAHSGEARALEELLTTIRPGLLAFFRQRSLPDAAEDLAQLASIRISGAIARIDPERADSYISTVARNLLRTHNRMAARTRAREGGDDATEVPADVPGADVRIEYSELVRAVHRTCQEKLPPGLREVAVGFVRGEDTAKIAADLHISPITVRTRLMRVRAVLRQELAPYIEADDECRRRPA